MRDKDDYEDRSSSYTQVKKKCKKKRPPVEEEGSSHRHRMEEGEPRRKEYRDRDYDEEPRRKEYKERDYEEDPRRKEYKERDYEEEPRRKEYKEREYDEEPRRKERDSDSGDLRRREREREQGESTGRKKCSRNRERRKEMELLVKVKEELISDEESPDRSRSPHSNRKREEKKVSNMEAIMNIKEEKHDWGRGEEKEKKKPMENKAKPDFGLSGKLVEETNIVNGVLIKYSEPEEARKPKVRWRLYPFKGDSSLPVLHIHRQSAYLIGRDRKIADLPVDHPSCSKQHAVLQFRLVPYTRPNGSQGKRVRPYIIDLESANGTFVNNKRIDAKKYVELLERDVIKFAFSSREYVLLHENSKEAHLDDDVQ